MNSFSLVSAAPAYGGSAEPCEAKGASVRTQVRTFKSCNLCPDSYRSRWSGMASHSLLQRRSAPRKAVRLLPLKRGRLLFCNFPLFANIQRPLFVCGILVFFSILIFLFSGVKISVFFLKTDISFIFILLLYQLYCKPKNIFS